jgi:hypothetical protein
MSNIESDSSDFWNLNKKSKNLNNDSESSDFWNLSKKKHSIYSSESFSTESDNEDKNIDKTKSKENNNKIVITSETSKKTDTQTEKNDLTPINIENKKADLSPVNIENKKADLTPVNIENKKDYLPPNKITYKNKNIGDFTIKEFYSSFMKSIIDMIKSLKQGKGLNEIFSDKDKLIHFGIILIIISILLVPLTLN